MSKFNVKRSLKHLYIEKHSLEKMIDTKESAKSIHDMTVKEFNDLRSEMHLLAIIKDDIQTAEEHIKREKTGE